MELRQLRYFIAVAEELHFGRASARLRIASPSLSQQIKALERQLGVRLFDRSSTGVALTAAGRELVPAARRALDAADEVEDAARRIADERATVLRLGFLAFSLTPTARGLLTAFGRHAPAVTVQLHQHEWDDPSAGVLSGATDAALVRPPFTGAEGLDVLVLDVEPVLVVVAHDHPLAGRRHVSVADLLDQPWLEAGLVTDPVFANSWYLRDLREARGAASPAVASRSTTVEEWLAEVAFGRGIDLVPAGLAEEYRRSGLAFLPVTDAPPSPLALAWRRVDPPPSVIELARFAARTLPSRRV